jgi:hypothetical protein
MGVLALGARLDRGLRGHHLRAVHARFVPNTAQTRTRAERQDLVIDHAFGA